MDVVLVTGAGGFIGGHLVGALRKAGRRVRAVDIKPFDEWDQLFPDVESLQLDLRQSRGMHQGGGGRAGDLQPGMRHGRHGLHRDPQG